MLQFVLPDLQRTEKKHWWMGRPLRVRIHLGVYMLQQMFNLTDRVTEQQVRDNAAFQLFCGYGLIKKWHAPDHTKIEAFRSRLSPETYADVLPILNDIYLFGNQLALGKYWALRRAVETLSWRGTMLLQNLHGYLFEGIINTSISSLHAYEVGCFNKGKLNKGLQFGRAYQLGRIGGNFLFVGECTSTYMPDAQSLPLMLNTHEHLFGKGLLASVATDKGYYSLSNEQLLIEKGVLEIQLPRPDRTLNAARETTPWTIRQLLHHRRAGIEPLIGHTKHGGQLGRSRMKSDATTKSAGYAAVFGFNLRQLTRCLAGEVRPKVDVVNNIAANNANIIEKMNMQLA